MRGEHKDPQAYRDISSEYTDRKRLLRLHDKNPSLELFVGQLVYAADGNGRVIVPVSSATKLADLGEGSPRRPR